MSDAPPGGDNHYVITIAELLSGPTIGAYRGSPSDALTDARDIVGGLFEQLLTSEEHAVIEASAQMMRLYRALLPTEPTGAGLGDLVEVAQAVHLIQNAVMARAAARAFPERYRL